MAKSKYAPSLFGEAEKPSSKIELSPAKPSQAKPINAQDKAAVAAHFKEIELSPYVPPAKKVAKEETKKEVIAPSVKSDWSLLTYSTPVPTLPPLPPEEQQEFIRNHKTLKQLKKRGKQA